MKKSLKVKLEMAKFLQKTLDEMAVQTQDSGHKSDAAREFAKFYERVSYFLKIESLLILKCSLEL